MDSGFKDRVDKIFASISSSSSSSWSLSDGEVERREWNRGTTESRDDNQIPVSSSFQDLDDNWDIRSSIGLDSTLDNEEEEDAYDQMAQGRENNAGPLLYMKDVNDHGHYLNSHNVLPKRAVKTRLKEDDADEPMLNAEDPAIKSILKRKTRDDVAEKPAKRVRFDSTCKDKDVDAGGARRDPTRVSGNVRAVPDYVLNPSNYTRYSLDDSDDYLEPSPKHGEESYELLPKSVVFIPRRKSRGDESGKRASNRACANVGIASMEGEEMKEDDDDDEDDDDVCTKARCRKPIRQYRAKMEDYEGAS